MASIEQGDLLKVEGMRSISSMRQPLSSREL